MGSLKRKKWVGQLTPAFFEPGVKEVCMVKVTVLGANGWYDDANGMTTCVFVEMENETILLDAGSGLTRARSLARKRKFK